MSTCIYQSRVKKSEKEWYCIFVCDSLQNIVRNFFVLFFRRFREIEYVKKKRNPAQGNKFQSLLEFLDGRLISFTSDDQFLARASKSHSRIKLIPMFTPSNSLHFITDSQPLDSCHLSYPYKPP